MGSDHVLIRLEVGEHTFRQRPFCFELAWCTAEGFSELIQLWWSVDTPAGCGAFLISKKVAWMKKMLKHWARTCFGSIKLKKLALMNELDTLDMAKETTAPCTEDMAKEDSLLQELEAIRRQEEI